MFHYSTNLLIWSSCEGQGHFLVISLLLIMPFYSFKLLTKMIEIDEEWQNNQPTNYNKTLQYPI